VLILINDTDWRMHAIVMHAVLTLTRRRLPIRTRLINSYRVVIWNLLCVDWRYAFVLTGHVLLHRDLLMILIVTTSSTLVPHSLRFIGLSIRGKVAIVVIDCRGHAMQFQSNTC